MLERPWAKGKHFSNFPDSFLMFDPEASCLHFALGPTYQAASLAPPKKLLSLSLSEPFGLQPFEDPH